MTIGRNNDWMECHDLLPPQRERVINFSKRENLQSFWNEMWSKRRDIETKLQEFAVTSAEKATGNVQSPIEDIDTGGVYLLPRQRIKPTNKHDNELIPKYEEAGNYDTETIDVTEYVLAKHNWWRFPFPDFQRVAPLVGACGSASPEWRDLALIRTHKLKLYYLVPERHMSTYIVFALFPYKMDGIHRTKYDAFDRCIKAWTAHLRTKYLY